MTTALSGEACAALVGTRQPEMADGMPRADGCYLAALDQGMGADLAMSKGLSKYPRLKMAVNGSNRRCRPKLYKHGVLSTAQPVAATSSKTGRRNC
jgi:hypothetical protein